jgi:hypothetical protein
MPIFLPMFMAMMTVMVVMPVVSAIVLEALSTTMPPSTDEFSQCLSVQFLTGF